LPAVATSIHELIHSSATPLPATKSKYDALLDEIGDRHLVLLGEASHGTHEFYRERAAITQRLISEKGFNAVAVEADWPDAFRVNQFVRGLSSDKTADQALSDFQRFPTWMWRNTEVRDFINWLKARNGARDKSSHAGFYGMDLYSLFTSIGSVLRYLDDVDPEAARRARYRYGCFDHFAEDSQAYGYTASIDMAQSCEEQVIRQLVDIQRLAARPPADGEANEEALFSAAQNARLVRNAERYYRSMFRGRVSSWNLRDRHMAETIDAISGHVKNRAGTPKIVIWAHNSHLGDARATDMGRGGELNVGQLIRQKYGDDSFLLGFTTYTGTVTAAWEWDGDGERRPVIPALEGSIEKLFHETELPEFLLVTRANSELTEALSDPILERAIGVIYRSDTERLSHYFSVNLAEQFDAVIHIDRTRALEPLEPAKGWHNEDLPETFPTGL
jgi:erythromycin esterase-like protein